MWLSKSSKFSRDDVKNSKTVPSASGSQQYSQHKKGGLSSQKRRREVQRDEDQTVSGLQSHEKPSPAKKTRAAVSSYEDDVSDDEFVVIELFSSDEQEKSSACSSSKKKFTEKASSKISLSQKKRAPVDTLGSATNSQVSPIYNTTSIFKRFQNQNEARGSKGKTGQMYGDDTGPMFTQQQMDTDLPLLPWPKKRVRQLSQSSNSDQSAGSQSSKRTSSQANSVSQVVKGVISNIKDDSSSDTDEPFTSKLQKKVLQETKPSISNSSCLDDSNKNLSQEFGKRRQSTEVKKLRQLSHEVSPGPVFLSLRTSKKKKSDHVSSDSFSDFVVVETASESSSEECKQKEESHASDGFDTIARKRSYLSKRTTAKQFKNLETNNNLNSSSETGRAHNSVPLQTKCGSKMKKGRKTFQLTSSDTDDNFSTLKDSSSCKRATGSVKSQKPCKLETLSKKSAQTTSLYYSDDDISCHSTESSGEETCTLQLKHKPKSSTDEETEEYQYDQLGTKTDTIIPKLSLVVSQSSKEKLKIIASCCMKTDHLDAVQGDDDESTQEYLYDDKVNESSLGVRKMEESIKKTFDEVQLESKVPDSDEDMTQAPDTHFDSQEGDDSDVLEIGLDEDLTQPLDSPMPDEDDELTQEPSQYGNPPQLSFAAKTQSFAASRRAGSVVDLEDPPQLTQQISKPTTVTCVSPASTVAYDSDSCHSNKTETFPNFDHQDSMDETKTILKKIESRSGGSTDSNASESCLMFKWKSKAVLKRTDSRSSGSTDSNASESCLTFKPKSKSILKRTGRRSSGSTDSNTIENGLKFIPVYEHPENRDHRSVNEKEQKMSRISSFAGTQICDNEMSVPKVQNDCGRAHNDVYETEMKETETLLGIQSELSPSKLSSSKSVMFNLDMPVDIKKEKLEDTTLKVKEENLETEQVTELPCKLPCYTQEEDVIFVYDSSDDEALIDLSQTNIRSDHLSDTDSMYGMFDHSDTELFDDDFSDHDIALVNEAADDERMALEDIAVEEKNPFDHLGESDSEDVKMRTKETGNNTKGKGTFNFDIEDCEVPETSPVSCRKLKKPSILEISSDSDNEAVPGPKSPPETSGHDSFDMELDDDIYFAAECNEPLKPKEKAADITNIFSAETQIQTMSDFKQVHIESDSSLFSALTEVTTTDSDTDVKEIQPIKLGFGTVNKTLPKKLKDLSVEVDTDTKRKNNEMSDCMKSDATLSDEDLYQAATQMDSDVSVVLKEKTVVNSTGQALKDMDTTLVPTSENRTSDSSLTDRGVGSQGKPKRKTASVMSLMMSSKMKDFKTPSVFTPVGLNKSASSNRNIFDVDTQKIDIGSSSRDPFKTSTPKITEGRPKSSPLFQLKKLNLQEMYDAHTQSMSPSNKDMAFQNQINLDDSNDEPNNDDALYKALDDLEETDLSYLDTTRPNQSYKENSNLDAEISHNFWQQTGNKCSSPKDNSIDHTTDRVVDIQQKDVFIAATQIDPSFLRSCVSDSKSKGLPEVIDDTKPLNIVSDEDPFSVMTQVDEVLPTKPVESTLQSKGETVKTKVPEILLNKIRSKHMPKKSIMVAAERLKKSVSMQKDKKETMKENVKNTKSNSLKVANNAGANPWLSKKKSPPISWKKTAAAANKKKQKQKSDSSFSLTQKIQAAKECQKKRTSKACVDPSLPTAKLRPAALHSSSSDVLPPDEDEIMAKGLPLLTFTKLMDKHKHDKSDSGKGVLERREEADMEVDDSSSVVVNSAPVKTISPPSDLARAKDHAKDKDKPPSKHSSSSKSSSSSSKSSSSSSRSGSRHSRHSTSSKLLNKSDVSKHRSKSTKPIGSPKPSGSSKSSSSSSRSHHRHSSSASKKVSSHSSSGSSKSTSTTSKHSHTSSKSSVSSEPSSASSKSSSSSVSKASSKSASTSSVSSSRALKTSHSPTFHNNANPERRNPLSEEDSVSTQHKTKGDQTTLHKVELESVSESAPTSRTAASTVSAVETKDKSFDLTLYPLPAVKKGVDKITKTTVSPQLGSKLEIRSRSPVNMNPIGRQLDTAVDVTSQKASVLQPASKKINDYPSPARLSTLPPAHHANDLPVEKLLKRLSDNDPRKAVQKQRASMVKPVSETGQPGVSRDQASMVKPVSKTSRPGVSSSACDVLLQASMVKPVSKTGQPGVSRDQASMVKPVSKTGQPGVSRDPRARSITAMSHAQPPNLLLKPSAAFCPATVQSAPLHRPIMGNRAVDAILPFSQMLRGTVAQPDTRNTNTVVKEVKDPSKLMDSTYYLSKVLCWNPIWLGEQNKPEFAGIPPPILQKDESVYPLLESYTNLEDYQTIMTRLLLLETWDMIFKEWKQKKTKTVTNMMFVSVDICNKQDKGGLSKFIWQGVLTREQFRRSQYPMEGDLIIMNVWGAPLPSTKDNRRVDVQPSWKAQFGYVERMNVRPSNNIHNLLRTYPVLKSSVDNEHGEFHILTVTALGRYRKFKPIGDRIMTIEPLCHMVTARRQFQALTYLPRSPLLRDILHPSSHRVFHHNTLIHDNSLLKAYNQSQAQAISAVCRAVREPVHMPRICLLQGPPGTGKTHTITGIITRIIQESGGKCCICLCTPSNGAADELMRRLIAIRNNGGRNSSMRLVRFGKTKSIHDDVLECAYDELVDKERTKEQDRKRRELSSLPESVKREQQQLQQKIERVQKELACLSMTANKIQVDRRKEDIRKFERELRYLDKQQSTPHQVIQLTPAEETRIRQRVLQDAHVICGTLNSIGSARIMNILRTERNRNPFLCTIIDEATQSTELDCLIPLQYGVSKMVLVGDPEQLPPTILSQRAKEMKFGLSLFERFYTYFKSKDQSAVMMLRTQYRMDSAILTFPNLYVYDGQLNTDRSVTERTKNFPLHPYLVLNIESGQEMISSEGSVSNQTEANCVAELCQLIVSRTKINPSRIGVICPYQSQRSLVLSSLSNKRLRDVDVGTVDGFQGREKHIIIMSCVRARSSDGGIGFLSDRRRMNVALTRAKYALYVLGHLDTLKRGPDWRALIDDAQRRNVIVNVPSVNQFSSVATQCFKAHTVPH